MAIERWTPFRDLRRFEHMHRHIGVPYHYSYAGGWAIPLDVERNGDDFVVRGALPGVAPSDIVLTIEDGVLTIEGSTASEGEHEDGGYVTPVDCVGEDATFVSRLRADPTVAHGLSLWVVSDNLRKGAALDAVQIAEELVQCYLDEPD